jgi:Zn-dependent protease with chaperone function
MRRFILTLLLSCLGIFPAYAVSMTEARAIYATIIAANHITNAPPLRYSHSKELNAYWDGTRIVVFQGVLSVSDRDNIALVLGHELSHDLLKHGAVPSAKAGRNQEYAADKWGAYLMNQAGYNVCAGVQLFKRFPPSVGPMDDHPDRLLRIRALGCH